jgi:hypothetical protein
MFLYTHPASCKISMSCVKEEMGCLTGWVAVMFLPWRSPGRSPVAAAEWPHGQQWRPQIYHASKSQFSQLSCFSLTGKKPFLTTEKKPINNMRIRMSIQNHSSACIEEKCHILDWSRNEGKILNNRATKFQGSIQKGRMLGIKTYYIFLYEASPKKDSLLQLWIAKTNLYYELTILVQICHFVTQIYSSKNKRNNSISQMNKRMHKRKDGNAS